MQFVYVLTGWEGSAADSRVLRDAINRANGLKVPRVVPLENGLDAFLNEQQDTAGQTNVEVIDSLETSPEWSLWRDDMAQQMFQEWSSLG
ncbi:hypothetical protein ACS0TY_003005 [Phlomoides rotata]